jgi:hypothetical protein
MGEELLGEEKKSVVNSHLERGRRGFFLGRDLCPKGPFVELLLKKRPLEDTGGPPMPLFEEAASSSTFDIRPSEIRLFPSNRSSSFPPAMY